MTLHRFYCQSLNSSKTELQAGEAHHLRVLRLKSGAQVELFDGNGTLATGIILSTEKNTVWLKIENISRFEPPKTRRITIAVSVPKGERFDWLIEKLTELGVDRICPVIFERTVRQPANPKAIDRWQNLAISAAKQCKRLFLPKIDPPANLADCLESIKKDTPSCRIIAGDISENAPSLVTQQFGQSDTAAFIGSEGGFTENEQIFLKNQGVQFFRLSDNILRTETAALAFAAILCAQRA